MPNPDRFARLFTLLLLASSAVGPGASGAFGSMRIDHDAPLRRNFGIELSENDAADAALESSLNAFLKEARSGAFTEQCVDRAHLADHGFFFSEVRGMVDTERRTFDAPTVLKSYSKNGRDYFITVAFTGVQDGAPFTYRVIEFKAVPYQDGYRFHCPLDDRTRNFHTTQVEKVTYWHSGPLDLAAASDFARFRKELCDLSGTPHEPLRYYKFETLDELLTSHGIVFSASKCNFLSRDLGFLESDGKTFITGADDAAYIAGYVEDYLERHVPGADNLYRPAAVGLAVCYGGYYLSGDDLATLKAQFREALRVQPQIDFLAEFRKARRSSIERHFCHYVICALLCEEVLERKGFDAALRLVHSGKDGERFFEGLKELLDVDETSFHAAVLRLIDAG